MKLQQLKLVMLAVFTLIPFLMYAQTSTLTKVPINTLNQNPMGYIEYLPENFDSSGNTKYPLLYWLHGLGNAGSGSESDLQKLYDTQIADWLKTNDIPFIVIVPQHFNGYFSQGILSTFSQWVNTEYSSVIDPYQKHMAGLSGATFGMASYLVDNDNTFQEFATFTPMAGNFNSALGDANYQKVIDNDQYIWFHHGTNDGTLGIGGSRRFHNGLYALDNTRSRLTAYDGFGHNVWDLVYTGNGRTAPQLTGIINGATYYNWTTSDPDVDWYGWMLAHAKTPAPPSAPTMLTLDNNSINENNPIGQAVGNLSSDGTAPLTYTLVSGAGDDDNSSFSIADNVLSINVSTDFETQSTYNIRVEATNTVGSIANSFTITIIDVNETPSDEITALINFGRNNSVPVSGWNNVFTNIPAITMSPVNLTDELGNTTSWQLSVTDGFLSTPNEIGPNPGDNSGRYPDEVLKYAWKDRYGGEVQITGLDNSKTYTIAVYGNTAQAEAVMRCLVNDNQVGGNVDVQNNALGADYLFEVINVIPEQSAITIRVEGDNSAVRNFGHLAAMVVKQEPVLVPTPPTAIFLDNNSIDEENAIGEFVGSFTSDGVPAVTYSLVPGTGDDDNASFSITGDMLHIQTVADFETKPSYSIRVQASNSEGLLEETFIINVNDIVEGPPVEIISRINFGRNNSTTVPGWNNIFQNNPVSSLPAVTLNDENGNVLPWQLTVTNDFLSTPNEVGPITGNDSGRYPDDVLAYAWKDRYGGEVEISGLDDNLSYTIRVYGNTLDDEALMRCFVNSTQVGGTVDVQNNATGADYEFETTSVSSSQGKITIRIEGDNSSVRNFGHIAAMTIIQEVDTPPTAPTLLTLDNAVIDENNAVGALIGTLTSDGTDPVYSLVSGIGDDDNASFSISGDQLTINVSADFEAQSSYSVRVEASNGLGSFAEVFAISINDVDENITGPVTALINFGRNNSTTVPGWNNVFQNAPTTAMVPVSITDDQGNATTWQLGVANDFLSTPNAVGPITGNNSGRYPDDVLAYAWKDRYGGVIELSGLSNDQLYTIRVYGNTGEDEALTKVSVNSSQIGTVVDMKNNAIINDYEFEVIDISPIQGKITIEVAGDNSSTRNFGHMVAMVVIQQFSGSSSTRQSFFEDSKSVEFSELKIFPNPVKDDLIIIPSKDLQINKLELYQVIGQTSMNVEFEIETGNQDNQVISMAGYKPGLYVLRIHTNKEIKSYKIVKE